MAITPISTLNNNSRRFSFGYINLEDEDASDLKQQNLLNRDKILAGIGSVAGVSLVVGSMMKIQKTKNPMNLRYTVVEMLSMAGMGNIGGIVLSSVGKDSKAQKKKWKEGAFQMLLTSIPMLSVDGVIKLCSKSRNKLINNNFTKILASICGVYVGSHTALAVSNKLRNEPNSAKPKRKLKFVDMVANLDDAVAIMVLAKIPFADKIRIERLLPFIYSFCGFRSGTGDKR